MGPALLGYWWLSWPVAVVAWLALPDRCAKPVGVALLAVGFLLGLLGLWLVGPASE